MGGSIGSARQKGFRRHIMTPKALFIIWNEILEEKWIGIVSHTAIQNLIKNRSNRYPHMMSHSALVATEVVKAKPGGILLFKKVRKKPRFMTKQGFLWS